MGFGQQISLSRYNEFSSGPDKSSLKDLFYYNENSSKSFDGQIANQKVYMFFQIINDSVIKGYYRYYKYQQNIPLVGKIYKDSIFIDELDQDSVKTALLKVKYRNDSLLGNWYSLKNNKEFKIKLIQWNTTGDTYTPNVKTDNSLSLVYRDNHYKIDLSKNIDNGYNYAFVVLYNNIIDDKFYAIIRFINYPLYPKAKNKYGWTATEHYLMFAKFDVKGNLDTIQVFEIISEIKNIENKENFGNIRDAFKDSLNIDIFPLNEDFKYNLTISRSNIEKGMIINKKTVNKTLFLYDTLRLSLESGYDLIVRYKLREIFEDSYYSYQVDSVYEKNHKSLNKLTLFCNDLKDYTAYYHNGQINFGDYKDVSYDDYNFDGVDDIYIFNHEGAGANNRAQTIWVYNKQTGKYEKDKFLSGLAIWYLDKKNKIITSGWRMSYIENETEDYQLTEGKWIKIATQSSSCNADRTIQTITKRKLVNGKWIEKKEINKLD